MAEGLRWWLLFLTAVMFSMSGCASRPTWTSGTQDLARASSTGPQVVMTGALIQERQSD